MATIKLTSKRQATFPKSVCEAMHLGPGARLAVTLEILKGRRVWCLTPLADETPRWFGCLRRFAKGRAHDMASIARSVERRLGDGRG